MIAINELKKFVGKSADQVSELMNDIVNDLTKEDIYVFIENNYVFRTCPSSYINNIKDIESKNELFSTVYSKYREIDSKSKKFT